MILVALDPAKGVKGSDSACGIAVFRAVTGAAHAFELERAAVVQCASKSTRDPLVDSSRMARAVCAWICRSESLNDVTHFVAEWPQVYRAGRGGAKDPNDLFPLAGVATAVAARLHISAQVSSFKPHVWKGTLGDNDDGEYLVEKILRKPGRVLSAEEIARVEVPRKKSLTSNVWDAVGIGCYATGRPLNPIVVER